MSGDSSLLTQDILEAIEKIETFVDNRTFSHFSSDQMCHDAVIRNLEVIGEAARNLPKDFVEANPDLPIKSAVEMRNVLIHDYGQVDLAIVWKTVTEDIPRLKTVLSNKSFGS